VSKRACGFAPRVFAMGSVALLVLSVVALCTTACGDDTPTTSTSVAAVAKTTTSTAPSATPTSSPTTEQTADTEVTETSVVSEVPAIELGNNDSGREVVLNLGDHVRIDLKPYINDQVKSVLWNYVPIVVQETDSGATVISDVVVECWLELEAVFTGPVTVRAEYEYPYGTVSTAWVVYLIVREPEEEAPEAEGE
jgi:hypothetical protein